MHTLPLEASDDEIKAVVAEWSELLAEGRFADALEMCPAAPDSPAGTSELLEKTIAGYGVPEPHPDGEAFAVTSLRDHPEGAEIVRDKIRANRKNLYGLDPARYLGMVHYHDVPLNGERSDLTARFHIRRVGPDRLALEFLDVHVM